MAKDATYFRENFPWQVSAIVPNRAPKKVESGKSMLLGKTSVFMFCYEMPPVSVFELLILDGNRKTKRRLCVGGNVV